MTRLPQALLLLAFGAQGGAGEAHLLDIPARFMWGWGPGLSGYCGSASMQSVALYFGNWLTQDAIRGSTGSTDASHEILLNNSECCSAVKAATHFALHVEEWRRWEVPVPQADAFLDWMRSSVDEGIPVIFGIYMTVESAPDNDHIVPFVGYDEDSIYFNDLYFNNTLRAPIKEFVKTREECHGVPEHVGAASYCLPQGVDYGYRVFGNLDPLNELMPLRLNMATNLEPDYSKEDGRHAMPIMLAAELVASGLTPGKRYAILRYTSISQVPRDGGFLEKFLASGATPEAYFVAPPSGTWTLGVHFPSDSTQFFRCVEEAAAGDVERPQPVTLYA